ncbi:phosphocholine cytidylyltransferase family protein [Thermofilum pendens]|uniref:Nucleotidyl transferase n=1 Tax=Thermofilum pendens (strain DSM 2475 / Hrk 5) TaxID=368408 RepID=A1RZL8_THEPD|nr:NTP transferase domain-containing protein [Thermofilum pendens]ABL78648.1 Nucleotidyl transferase [Thermofilum pendens Hrk 5]
MDVVIVAAGEASRLRPYSEEMPKTLMELRPGLPIIDFILKRVMALSPRKVVVVTRRTWKDILASHLAGLAEVVTVDLEGGFGNLYSVYTALTRVGDEFLILMSDHIFEEEVLMRLAEHASKASFTVCLDRNPSRSEAVEGLKVIIEGGLVRDAGKDAAPRYGIDTGAIMARGRAKEFIEEVIRQKGPGASIADVLRFAASKGEEVDYVDVTGLLWKDIDTPEDLVKARKLVEKVELRELAKRTGDPLSRALLKPLTTRLSMLALKNSLLKPAMLTSWASAFLASWALLLPQVESNALLMFPLLAVHVVASELLRELAVLASWDVTAISQVDFLATLPLAAFVSRLADTWPLSVLAGAGILFTSLAGLPRMASAEGYSGLLVSKLLATIVLSLSLFVGGAIYGVAFCALMPWLHIALRLKPRRSGLARGKEPSHVPIPAVRVDEIAEKIESLVTNVVKLAVVLAVLTMLSPLSSDVLFQVDEYSLRVGTLLTVAQLTAVVYYGYKILEPLFSLLDALATRLVEKLGVTRYTARRILVESVYLVLIVLTWFLLPSLKNIPGIGGVLYRVLTIVIVALFALISYDLVRLLFRVFEDTLKRIVHAIARFVSG